MTNPAQPGPGQGGSFQGGQYQGLSQPNQPPQGPAPPGPPPSGQPWTGGMPAQHAPVGHPGYGPGPAAPPTPRGNRRLPAPLITIGAALLVVAAGLAVGGSFTTLEIETQRLSDTQDLVLTYTAWHLSESGTLNLPIDFHAPHFGYPLAAGALLAFLGAALVFFGRGQLARLARPAAVAGAALLAGAVWAVAMSVSAELDDVEHRTGYNLDWTAGLGFWLILGAGAAAVVGGLLLLFAPDTGARATEPATPRYGIPALGRPYQPGQQSGHHQPVPQPGQQSGHHQPVPQPGRRSGPYQPVPQPGQHQPVQQPGSHQPAERTDEQSPTPPRGQPAPGAAGPETGATEV